MVLMEKNLPANAGDTRDASQSLGREDPLEKGTATHSSILAWRILWTEELSRGHAAMGPVLFTTKRKESELVKSSSILCVQEAAHKSL